MTFLPRQLPISRVDPISGESFASYAERLAATLPVKLPLITLLTKTGIVDVEEVKYLGGGYGITLPEERVTMFAHATRLSVETVRSLLLQTYNGRILNLEGLDPESTVSIRTFAVREWAYFVGTHFCPACLAEDQAWRLAWKLPWSFACVKHAKLLADVCPRCARDRETSHQRSAANLDLPL